jgi:predicted DNA-binding transcriptional regulator AlpA
MSELEDRIAAIRLRELWRFADMVALGIVLERTTLRRWMESDADPFPQPLILTPNSLARRSAEVMAWLSRRPRGVAPQQSHIAAEARKSAMRA